MAKLIAGKSCVIVASGLTAIAVPTCFKNKEGRLDIPEQIKSTEINEAGDSSTDTKLNIIAVDISVSEKYVVLCTSNKLVVLWEVFKDSPLSTRISARVVSKVKFFPSERAVILADKSGDAYEFSVTSPHLEGKLLLGHLSMLLDVLVTPDEKFIITCDRDEKIRVSCYPNAYNIQSYCLGHREFVTGIFLLSHDETVLVSYSGGGCVKFWNYKTGDKIYSIESNVDLMTHINMNTSKEEDNDFPIVLATCCSVDSFSSVICCCFSGVQNCFVYHVTENLKNITHKLIQTIRLQFEPWDMMCFDRCFWILGPLENEFLSLFEWNTNISEFEKCTKENMSSIVQSVNKKNELFKNADPTTFVTLLYKRRYDNVQEYQNRKKQRLASSANVLKHADELD